jgi:TRAP-type C4-dicarboxylate transport system substrate-binding protein
LTREQQAEQILDAKKKGVTFYRLSEAEKTQLIKQSRPMYDKWGGKIGIDYLRQVQSTLGD